MRAFTVTYTYNEHKNNARLNFIILIPKLAVISLPLTTGCIKSKHCHKGGYTFHKNTCRNTSLPHGLGPGRNKKRVWRLSTRQPLDFAISPPSYTQPERMRGKKFEAETLRHIFPFTTLFEAFFYVKEVLEKIITGLLKGHNSRALISS